MSGGVHPPPFLSPALARMEARNMSRLLQRLWDDDRGVVISIELILVIGLLIFGIVAGLVAVRNSVIAAFGTTGNTLTSLVPSYTYSGFILGGFPGGNIAQIQGYQADSGTVYILTGDQLVPLQLGTAYVIPPSP
jgi:Flp pilus assembly pilin Flp